jgi:hypothetical protein
MSPRNRNPNELKLTAALYATRPGVVEHVRLTDKLPDTIPSGGAHIGMRLLIEGRGTDPDLSPDEQLVHDAIVREGRLPGGSVVLAPPDAKTSGGAATGARLRAPQRGEPFIHLIRVSCGSMDTGDELSEGDWMSVEATAAGAHFNAAVERCLAYMESQASIVNDTPGLQWTEPYVYSVICLEVPVSWIDPGEKPIAALERWAALDDDFAGALGECVTRAAEGSWDQGGLSELDQPSARAKAVKTVSEQFGC